MPETDLPLGPKEEIQLSKLLSYLLRHGAVKEKLVMSPDGFVAVDDIVSWRSFDINLRIRELYLLPG